MSEKRRHTRTKFNAKVRVTHPDQGIGVFRTGDISDGGVFIEIGPIGLAIGDLVTVQVVDTPVPAPEIRMRVVRIEAGGYGLRFA